MDFINSYLIFAPVSPLHVYARNENTNENKKLEFGSPSGQLVLFILQINRQVVQSSRSVADETRRPFRMPRDRTSLSIQ